MCSMVRAKLLHVASLDVLGPLRDVNLVLVLHVLREGLAKLSSISNQILVCLSEK